MGNDSPMRNESCSFMTGVKTAALIVILGVVAAVADHAFFIAPQASVQRVNEATPAAMAPSPSGAFAVPEHLRPNAGDVTEHVTAF